MLNLNTDVRFLKGVGEKKAEILYNMGIDTIGALLRFYPRDYKDLSDIKTIGECCFDQKCCVKAKIITPITEHFIRRNMTLYKFSVTDGKDNMSVTIFNNKYLAKSLHIGSEYLFYGKITFGTFLPDMSSPEIMEVGALGIHPVYKTSAKMSSKAIEKLIKTALMTPLGEDTIPLSIRKKADLSDLKFALDNIHFPKSYEALNKARKRLVFEELFTLQLGLMLLKGKKREENHFTIKSDYTDEFCSLLPFGLTNGQRNAISDCLADMSSNRTMNRLVQGDVGSGKTAVAAAIMYTMAKNNIQSALMAPTEILAEQHYNTLISLFEGTDLKCCLLTGSITAKNKSIIKEKLKKGEYDIAVGTHALICEDVSFKNLGLVITDEQHRFGVEQRSKLSQKGNRPHTLVMSATPIPRTLAFIIYGDLDISIIDEYPKGRQKVQSFCVDTTYRKRLYNFIKKHIAERHQCYIVCPLVEESEDLSALKSAESYYEELKEGEFKGYPIGLLHGKMNPKEKELVMRKFKDGEIKLLVCTTVIEVGIDVPNATVMVIENAERFGLSQLHQLRGRIGRGEDLSTCVFVSDAKGKTATERLSVIKNSSDGFYIADEDLKLRGPGDFLGNRQHGLPELKIADISADISVLRLAGNMAEQLLKEDPKLKLLQNKGIREEIISLYKKLNEN